MVKVVFQNSSSADIYQRLHSSQVHNLSCITPSCMTPSCITPGWTTTTWTRLLLASSTTSPSWMTS